jgi:3-dehydroquinate dehydratase-2
MRILVINGPNLNFLGIREKGIYGTQDYNYLLSLLEEKAKKLNIVIETFQSNCEGELIDRIQKAYYDQLDGIIINPGAYTHYSYAIRDALTSITAPKIEVHISNIHQREEFRHTSVTAPVCTGQIAGLGLQGYLLAVDAIIEMKKKDETFFA